MRIRRSSVKALHERFAEAAESWRDLSLDLLPYVYQHGVAHFLNVPESERAQALLRSFEYIYARMGRMGGDQARSVRDDHVVVEKHTEFCEAFAHQTNFYRSKAHVLAQSDADWPASTLLLQLALDHADNSPVTQAAHAWSERSTYPRLLRLESRPEKVQLEPLIKVVTGTVGLGDHLLLPDQKLLVWERGAPHRREPQSAPIWCLSAGEVVATLEGHQSWILGAEMLGDTRILSWSSGQVLITNIDSPHLAIELGVSGNLFGVRRVDEHRILCWGSDGVSLWDVSTGGTSLGHWLGGDAVSAVASHGDNLLVGTRSGFREDRSGQFHRISLIGESTCSTPVLDEWAKGCIQISPREALCWAKNFMFLWDQTEDAFTELSHTADIGGAIHLSDGALFSWQSGPLNRGVRVDQAFADETIGILWSPTGERLATMRGHGHWISSAMALPGGRILTGSADETSIIWDRSGVAVRQIDGQVAQGTSGAYFSSGQGGLARWTSEFDEPVSVYPAVAPFCEVSPALLLTWDADAIKLWDTSERWAGFMYQPDERDAHAGNVEALPLTETELLTHSTAWGEIDNIARVWDLETCAVIQRLIHPDSVRCVKHLTNDLLVTASRDSRVRWWDWRSGEITREAEANAIRIRSLTDGVLLTECPEGFRTWTDEGEPLSTFLPGGAVDFSGPLLVLGDQALVVVRPKPWREAPTQLYLWNYRRDATPRLLSESERTIYFLRRVDDHPVSCDEDGEVTVWSPNCDQALRRFPTMAGGLRSLLVVGDTLIGADYLNISCWDINGDLLWTREEEHGLVEHLEEIGQGVMAKWCFWKSQWPDEASREQLPLDPKIELFDPTNGQTLRILSGCERPPGTVSLLDSGEILCTLIQEGVSISAKDSFNLWSTQGELVLSQANLTELARANPAAARAHLSARRHKGAHERTARRGVLNTSLASLRFSEHAFNVNPNAIELWDGLVDTLETHRDAAEQPAERHPRLRWYSDSPCRLIRVDPDGSAIIMHEGALKRLISHRE